MTLAIGADRNASFEREPVRLTSFNPTIHERQKSGRRLTVMRVKRSSLTIVVVIAATVLVSGSQCARVNDQALGPAVQTQDQPVSLCFKACAQTAKEMRQAEQARFIAAIQACTDPQCRQEQASIHQENLQQIEMAQEECEAGCHEQGGGSGGE